MITLMDADTDQELAEFAPDRQAGGLPGIGEQVVAVVWDDGAQDTVLTTYTVVRRAFYYQHRRGAPPRGTADVILYVRAAEREGER